MQPVMRDVLARRKDRAIATILGVKERDCDEFLSSAASMKLRKTILDQINDLHAFFLDLMKSYDDDDIVMNQHYLQKIDKIYQTVVGDDG